MEYCQHYDPQGVKKGCKAGMDIEKIQCVPTGTKGIKWGPCIGGHKLADPLAHCAKWLRRTREQGEKRADNIERSIKIMTLVMPAVDEWRKTPPIGKAGVIKCPACGGDLHLSQSSYNGHVHARCSTVDCVAWME